jgi:tRNA(Ile)-lysidine synthetase-like protein
MNFKNYPHVLYKVIQACRDWWQHHPELHKRPVYIGVSGGVDSLMLWSALETCHERKEVSISDLSLFHIQYPFRKSAVLETRFIQKQARLLNRPLEYEKVEANKILEQENQEALARERRLQFCQNLLQKKPNAYFLLGRHGSDGVEDYWMRAFRHPTPWTWQEKTKTPLTQFYPLENLSKEEILEAYRHTGWPVFFDHTNTNLTYRRNRLRHQLQQFSTLTHEESADPFKKMRSFLKLDQTWQFQNKQALEYQMNTTFEVGWRQRRSLSLEAIPKSAISYMPMVVWEWLSAHAHGKSGVNTTCFQQLMCVLEGKQFPKELTFPKLGTVVVKQKTLKIQDELPTSVSTLNQVKSELNAADSN